jgi:hypothetical protein
MRLYRANTNEAWPSRRVPDANFHPAAIADRVSMRINVEQTPAPTREARVASTAPAYAR